MKKKVDILVANPSGNITIFVLTPFGRNDYQKVANQLLDMKELKGEQVAFIKEPYPGVNGKMEMCGLEFCGNASRSFGLICAINDRKYGKCQSVIDVSGCNELLTVDIDLNSNYTKVKMPKYKSVKYSEDLKAQVVDMGGIIHVVYTDQDATEEKFLEVKNYINEKFNPPAMGVMFYHPKTEELTPIVYVKDVDSTYWEGSCGSGSTAVAIAMTAAKIENGEADTGAEYKYYLKQPAGTIIASAKIENGKVGDVFIEGPVPISDLLTVDVEL